MATLKSKHKSFIVMRLACYETPTDIQEAFQEQFGVSVSPSQISYYNPNGAQGSKQLADKWKDLFTETRVRFNEMIQDIPIANKAYRLKKLQRNMERLEKMRNYKGANETIEQAAKEVGGAFTNKTELDHTLTGGVLVAPEKQDPEKWAKDVVAYQKKIKEMQADDGG